MPPKRKRGGRRRTKPVDVRDLRRKALTREIKLAALNTDRYRRLWREMLMRMTLSDIGRKVEIAWQTLEHALDLKDYSISLLLDALQEAELQRQKADGAHMETIDRSLKAHEARLAVVDSFFHRNVETAFAEKTFQFENIHYCRNKGEVILRKISLLVNHRNENTLSAARSTAISKTDAFVEDGKNERRLVTAQLQKQLEDLWDKLRSVFFDYRKSTEERRRIYETIRKKDESDRRTLIEQSSRIAYLLEEIARFREKILSYRNDVANELHNIVQESRFFHNTYREANESFIFGRKKDKHRTMTMSKEYNSSIKHLKSLTFKAERILVYMQTCRKYETQDEKVLPAIVDRATLQIQVAPGNDLLPLDPVAGDFQNLISFWHRLAFARLIVAELRMERNRLVIRTNNLRQSVKRCFTSGAYSMSQFTKMEINE